MNDTILYRPNENYALFLGIGLVSALFCFAVTVGSLRQGVSTAPIPAVIAVLSTWLAKESYDALKTKLIFDPNGIRIIGGKRKDRKYVLWKEVPYGYYVTPWKGDPFMVLSPQALSKGKIRRIVDWSLASKVSHGSVIAFCIGNPQNEHLIKELIVSNVLHIKEVSLGLDGLGDK